MVETNIERSEIKTMTVGSATKIWGKIRKGVITHLKVYLLKFYVNDIIAYFEVRILMIVRRYSKYLPSHVVDSEIDDLRTVAQLEFLETMKVWEPHINSNIWPLAQSRMIGAMKDHIRYITKSDPSRLYDWISDAAYMYQAVEKDNNNFEKKFETGDQLGHAMEALSARERQVVLSHAKDDLTFKNIGEVIGVSESQASRIYKQSIVKLKKQLAKK